MFIGLFLIIASLALSWWYYYVYRVRALKNVPGPIPLPIIGNALTVGNSPEEFLEFLVKTQRLFTGPYKLFLGVEPWVIFSTPDAIGELLSSTSQITKSPTYDHLRPWLGDGLLMSTGQKWRNRRKLLTPCFHFEILDGFLPQLDRAAKDFVLRLGKTLGPERDSIQIDLHHYIYPLSLDIICETSLGVKMDIQSTEEEHPYIEAVKNFSDIITKRVFSPLLLSDPIFNLLPVKRLYEKSLECLHQFTIKAIATRRQLLTDGTTSCKEFQNANEMNKKKKYALLDTLLQANDLDEMGIREEIDTFTFRGHDTTSLGLTFTLYALATNPVVQQRTYDEICEYGDDLRTMPSIGTIQKLEYLDRVIKEGLRRYPSVPLIERVLDNDTEICGIRYPKGQHIDIQIYSMHNDERLYPEPDRFDPDRFLPENTQKRHYFAYVPFSAGPRNCIGQKFALLEMKMVIIRVLQEYELFAVAGFKPILGLSTILRSTNGVLINYRRRQCHHID